MPVPRTSPSHGTLNRVRRTTGLEADPAQVASERAAMAEAQAEPGGRGRSGQGDASSAGRGSVVAITDAPKIVTSRLGHADSHTLERYLATGGYEGLRKALTMTPEAVAHEVDTASLLGRGGAGFPAGRKWAMLRKNPVTYLVVNGDESEPATFKDHLLVERDPHQLIEGVLIAAYALQVTQVFIFVRGEFALGLERVQAALNDAYAHGAVGADIFGSGFSVDVVVHPGAGRLHLRRGDRPARVARGQAGLPPHQAPVLPRRHRPLRRAHRGQQRGDHVQPARGSCSTAAPPSPPSGEGRSTGTRLFALAGHVNNPGVFELEMVKTTFHDLINAPVLGGGIPHGRELKAFIPGGVSAPWFGPDQIDLPLGQDEVAAAGSMLGLGLDRGHGRPHLRGAGRVADHQVLRPGVVRPVHPVPRGLGLAGEDHGAHRDGPGPRGGPRPAARRLRQHRPRADLAAPADHHLRARARPSPRPSARPSRCSATSSWSTSRREAAPMSEPTPPPRAARP